MTEDNAVDAAPVSAQALLVTWANKQDGWVRRIVAEVLASRAGLTAAALDEIYGHYLVEKQLIEGDVEPVPELLTPDSVESESSALVITKLSNVAAVNALAGEQEIAFNSGLTVLFGENGAGKTGYTRILKQMAAVRTAEPILGNVHDPTVTGEPEATIDYSVGGEANSISWTGERGVPPFTSIGIFDSPAVVLHVDNDLSYVYTPADLALFPHVTDGIEGVRARLEEERTERRPDGNPFLSFFTRGTAAYTAIEALGAATNPDALRTLSAVSEDEAKTLASLESQVQALQSSTVTAQLAVARTRAERYQAALDAAVVVSRFDLVAYNEAVTARVAAETDYAKAREELFAVAGLDGNGDAEWQTFILGADAYREHLGKHDYPAEGDNCLYCRQALGDDAVDLLTRYRAFASDESRKRVEQAQALAATLSRDVATLSLAPASSGLRGEQGEDEDTFLVKALEFFASADVAKQAIGTGVSIDASDLRGSAEQVVTTARARIESAEGLVSSLESKSGDRKEALDKAKSKYEGLKDRLTLQQRLEAVLTHIDAAKWDDTTGTLLARMTPVKRSLTDVSKVASQELLNTDFSTRFKDECAALRAPKVELEFPGRSGQAARRKKVTEHRPSAVLSEGEQKVIALADFLAEGALRLTLAPLVFDDPVNSLDYRRIREVADRVAALAKDRQVIVFTHNIWFATELLSRFESDAGRCSYFAITDDPLKGIVTAGVHPRWDTLKKTRGKINSVRQDAKTASGETREALIERGYSLIRTWCEIAVESELLAGVTQRYQANVVMGKLAQIRGERLDDAVSVIEPIFAKACRIMDGHSQPLETLGTRATLEELETDWAALEQALDAYKAA